MSNNNGEFAVTPTESETTGTVGHVSHGSRETPATSTSSMGADRSEKARGHKSDRHVAGESDSSIVPKKSANNGGVPLPAESMEGRGLTKEHVEQWLLDRTQRRVSRSRGLLGVRASARPRRAGWSSPSKVRAVCGSAARTDLCGGRSAMTVPTAIVFSWQDRDGFGRRSACHAVHVSLLEISPSMSSTAKLDDSRCLIRPLTTPRVRRFWLRPTTGPGYASRPMA